MRKITKPKELQCTKSPLNELYLIFSWFMNLSSFGLMAWLNVVNIDAKYIWSSAEGYQQILGPGHTVSRWQTQSDRDETQHRLPDPSGPVFGLGRHVGLLALLRGKPSFDRSVASKDFDNFDWQLDVYRNAWGELAKPAASFHSEAAFNSFLTYGH